jgi:hypothetical protein
VSALLLTLVLHATCPSPLEPEERAQAACDLLAQQKRAPAPDRALLLALLEEPEFSRARNRNSNAAMILWKRFWAWVQELLETKQASEFAQVAPYIVLAAAFAGVLFGVLQLRRRREPGRVSAGAAQGLAPLELEAPDRHLARARSLLGTSPREAIREGLLALLSSLERRKLARPDRVKTNRELCAELPRRGAPEPLVREVGARLNWYDRAFYSLGAVDAGEASAFLQGVEALIDRAA